MLDPKKGALLADFGGKTTLGEHYADAVLDIKGPDFARKHFLQFAKNPVTALVPEAKNAVKKLFAEIPSDFRTRRDHFNDNYNGVYPETFARSKERTAALIGYSERFYYIQLEYLRTPWARPVGEPYEALDPAWFVVRPFSYSTESKGTPSWVDGFVIPKGKLAQKRKAIAAFLAFVNTYDGLKAFLRPSDWTPATYLLPANASIYDADFVENGCPAIRLFRDALKTGVPLSGENMYNGIRNAGTQLGQDL